MDQAHVDQEKSLDKEKLWQEQFRREAWESNARYADAMTQLIGESELRDRLKVELDSFWAQIS